MQTDIHSDAEPELETSSPGQLRRRLALVLSLVLVVLVLAFIPPLINVSRLQRRIAHNISLSIGRPVHFDRLSLTLLPTAGFTLENFVISEDPAFGYEPILRADEVHARLRLSSLWRGHPEFSTISFSEPTSVNLVHLADGRWNIQSLLFQASHIPAAPTAQRFAGPAPRFPYIEATGARVNLKLDQRKTPISFDQAEFALWEPEPDQWKLRLSGRPIRTNVAPGETGTVRMEATLGAPNKTASSLAATPISLNGDWHDAQLGGITQFATGSDAGLRGDLSGSFGVEGTLAENKITAQIRLLNARRADFIPPAPLSLEARCEAHASELFHSFTDVACYWPPPETADPSTLIAAAQIPDVRTPETATVRISLPAVPASTFFNWVSVATPHPPLGLAGPGTLSGQVVWGLPDGTSANQSSARPGWTGELELFGGTISIPNQPPVELGDILLDASQPAAPAKPRRGQPAVPVAPPAHDSFDLEPMELDLGGKSPATLTGHVDDSGYTLHLTGSVLPSRLLAVGKAVPQLGEGLASCLPAAEETGGTAARTAKPPETPIHVDLTATRTWGGPQSWCPAQASAFPGP